MPSRGEDVDNEVSITIRGREQVACVMEALCKAGYVHAQAQGQPAASAERSQVTDYLLEALPKFLGTAMDADDMREMAKIISDVEALQSVPSSPPTVSSGYLRELDRLGKGQRDVPSAAPSDAGQPAIAQHEMNRLAKEIKEDFEDEICGCHSGQCRDEMIWRAELAKAEMPALEKLRERIERLPRIGEGDWVSRKDVIAALAAPAPRPAEKD